LRIRIGELCVIAALALMGCEAKTDAPSPALDTQPLAEAIDPVTSAPVIVMLGDSLTAGFQLPAGSALPAALQRQFDAQGVPARFVNAGVSGDTTADGLNRYEWSVEGSNANLLVVALGANDFLNDLPPDVPKKNLAAILDKAKADNLPVALVGVAIPEAAGAPSDKEAAYAAIYPELAQQYGVPYLPNMLAPVAGRSGLLQPDGVHPTAEGVEAMAAAIARFLAPLVEDLD